METAIVLGFLGMTTFWLYMSKTLLDLPKTGVNKELFRWLNTKNLGVFSSIIAMWLMSAMFGFLAIISNAQTYNTLIDSLSIAFFWINAGFMIIYVSLYMIFTIKNELEANRNLNKIKKW